MALHCTTVRILLIKHWKSTDGTIRYTSSKFAWLQIHRLLLEHSLGELTWQTFSPMFYENQTMGTCSFFLLQATYPCWHFLLQAAGGSSTKYGHTFTGLYSTVISCNSLVLIGQFVGQSPDYTFLLWIHVRVFGTIKHFAEINWIL